MATGEKIGTMTTEDFESGHNDKVHEHVAIQTDTFAINEDALGENLPPNYWRSPGFIGTVAALCFGNISNYASWVLPSNSLALINASIGPSDQISWVALSYTLNLSIGRFQLDTAPTERY